MTHEATVIEELVVGQLYSNEDIFRGLRVSNAGGIRPLIKDGSVKRVAVMSSVQDFHAASENPYHDRLEGEILTYTAAGKSGQQTLKGKKKKKKKKKNKKKIKKKKKKKKKTKKKNKNKK